MQRNIIQYNIIKQDSETKKLIKAKIEELEKNISITEDSDKISNDSNQTSSSQLEFEKRIYEFLSLVPEGGSLMFAEDYVQKLYPDNFNAFSQEKIKAFKAEVEEIKEQLSNKTEQKNALDKFIEPLKNYNESHRGNDNRLVLDNIDENSIKPASDLLLRKKLYFPENIVAAQSYVFNLYLKHLGSEFLEESQDILVDENAERTPLEKFNKAILDMGPKKLARYLNAERTPLEKFNKAILDMGPKKLARYLSDPLNYLGFWNHVYHFLNKIARLLGLGYDFSTKEVIHSLNQSQYDGGKITPGDGTRLAELLPKRDKYLNLADVSLDNNDNFFGQNRGGSHSQISNGFEAQDRPGRILASIDLNEGGNLSQSEASSSSSHASRNPIDGNSGSRTPPNTRNIGLFNQNTGKSLYESDGNQSFVKISDQRQHEDRSL